MMMQTTGLTVDVVRANPARFRHPLLLLHGLWTGSWIWRDLVAHLANRGWEAWVPSLLDATFAPSQEHRVGALTELCRAMSAPPVIVAHDAAVSTAVILGRAVRAPAIVALAPWSSPNGRLSLLADRSLRGAVLFARTIPPPHGGHPLLAGIESRLPELQPDSAAFVRATCAGFSREAEGPPGLVLAGRTDPAVSTEAARRLASTLEWSCDVHETAGHFPMLTGEAARIADRIHRWIVRTTGPEMLLWGEDEDDG